MRYIVFNPTTGEISARLIVADNSAMKDRIDIAPIDLDDYDSAPEMWAEIDIATKKLKVKPGKEDPRKKKP